MRLSNFHRAWLLAAALSLPGAVSAQDIEPSAAGQPAAHLPGNSGTAGATIRINRGAGFAAPEETARAGGVVSDASRPVTVSDVPASRVGREVSRHRWGAGSSALLGSGDKYVIINDRYGWKRPKYRGHDRYGYGKRPIKRHGHAARDRSPGGIFLPTGN